MTELNLEQWPVMADLLDKGKVGLIPTDTVYGLVCRPDRPAGKEQIYTLKNRPATMNLPVFVGSRGMARNLGLILPPAAERLFESPFVPGGLTLILSVDKDKAPEWLAHRDEIAVRWPDHQLIQNLLNAAGPLLCTSANAHGSKVDNRSFTRVTAELPDFDGFAVNAGDLTFVNSTIVNCTGAELTVQREGAIPFADIQKWLAA